MAKVMSLRKMATATLLKSSNFKFDTTILPFPLDEQVGNLQKKIRRMLKARKILRRIYKKYIPEDADIDISALRGILLWDKDEALFNSKTWRPTDEYKWMHMLTPDEFKELVNDVFPWSKLCTDDEFRIHYRMIPYMFIFLIPYEFDPMKPPPVYPYELNDEQ
jgi:hypothetical protein